MISKQYKGYPLIHCDGSVVIVVDSISGSVDVHSFDKSRSSSFSSVLRYGTAGCPPYPPILNFKFPYIARIDNPISKWTDISLFKLDVLGQTVTEVARFQFEDKDDNDDDEDDGFTDDFRDIIFENSHLYLFEKDEENAIITCCFSSIDGDKKGRFWFSDCDWTFKYHQGFGRIIVVYEREDIDSYGERCKGALVFETDKESCLEINELDYPDGYTPRVFKFEERDRDEEDDATSAISRLSIKKYTVLSDPEEPEGPNKLVCETLKFL